MTDQIDDALRRAHAEIDDWVRNAQERAEASRKLAEDVEALRETETTGDRSISVTVDAAGRLVDLKLRETAMDFTSDDLAAEIMQAIQKAGRRAGEKAAQMATDVWGEDSPTAQQIRQAYNPTEDNTPQPTRRQSEHTRPGSLIDPTGSLASFMRPDAGPNNGRGL